MPTLIYLRPSWNKSIYLKITEKRAWKCKSFFGSQTILFQAISSRLDTANDMLSLIMTDLRHLTRNDRIETLSCVVAWYRTFEACNLVARSACDEDWRRFSWEILRGKRSTNGQSNRWHIWQHIWRYNLTSCHAIQHDTSRLETMARNVWSSINRALTSVTTSATIQLVRSWVLGQDSWLRDLVPYYMLAMPKYFTILVAIPCWPQIKLWW